MRLSLSFQGSHVFVILKSLQGRTYWVNTCGVLFEGVWAKWIQESPDPVDCSHHNLHHLHRQLAPTAIWWSPPTDAPRRLGPCRLWGVPVGVPRAIEILPSNWTHGSNRLFGWIPQYIAGSGNYTHATCIAAGKSNQGTVVDNQWIRERTWWTLLAEL